jgi:hypothetical protein
MPKPRDRQTSRSTALQPLWALAQLIESGADPP